MMGIVYSLAAGVIIAIQGVINTRASEKAGFWLTNVVVHGSGFLLSLILYALLRDGSVGQLNQVPKGYLLGGVLGVMIVFTVMKSIDTLGPAYSVAIVLITQLLFALAIDSFGWFGTEKVPFSWNKAAGIALLLAGIVVFKWK